MDNFPRNYGEQCRFDSFCKTVLRNEAANYFRDLNRQREHETSISALSKAELDQLVTTDQYPSDSYVFSAHGYNMYIDNELLAEAFSSLSEADQGILILYFALDMTDNEISGLMGMSRSAVQRHRAKALAELRSKLKAIMPEGGKANV